MIHRVNKQRIVWGFVLFATALPTLHGYAQNPSEVYTCHSVTLITADASELVERNAIDLFTRRLSERTHVPITIIQAEKFTSESIEAVPNNTIPIVVGIEGSHNRLDHVLAASEWTVPATAEGYLLHVGAMPKAFESRPVQENPGPAVWLCGRDARGVVCGLGKLLREIQYQPDTISIHPFHLETAPQIADRGVYFATHFYNYYEGAPETELERYVEDLALWGFNTIWTWFDMNWYPEGFWDDPNSRGMRMVNRIRRINRVAQNLGVRVGLGGVANEGFQRQPPPELRADPSDRRGAYYPDSQICPSQPAGLEMILRDRRKVLELIGPIQVYWNWPYDSGGCGCRACRPWAKTFLQFAPAIADVVREQNPQAAYLLSTWFLNPEERAWVYELLKTRPAWLGGLVMAADFAGETEIPTPLVKLAFPEISMFDCYFISYGSNGANPAPHRFVAQARSIAAAGYGTALYSEGIYEDINKIVWACVLWDPARNAEDILSEYCRYYFGEERCAATVEAILELEETWGPAKLREVDQTRVEALHDRLKTFHTDPPEFSAGRVRGSLLYHRSLLDMQMARLGSDRPLRERALELYTQLADADSAFDWKPAVETLLPVIEARVKATNELFQTYWDYLSAFHLLRTILVFRPDEATGTTDFTRLAEALRSALQVSDVDAGRETLRRGLYAWQWYEAMKRTGTRMELYRITRLFFEDVAYANNPARVCDELARYRTQLETVVRRTEAVLEADWERAALDLPAAAEIFVADRTDYAILLEAVREAETVAEDEAMGDILYRAFHRWFWLNNVPLEFLFS